MRRKVARRYMRFRKKGFKTVPRTGADGYRRAAQAWADYLERGGR